MEVSGEKRTREQADAEAPPAPPIEPAYTFPYPLDPFQQRSIDILEANESVLVSAHTSAGKTTVALYAIARALKQRKRVIYTSPIKALSNQKFREFAEKFDSVGLMTGDTTIKPDSDCLVMTTEILRSMLYRGTEMLREVGCVVFDEVHYMRDKNRGVVWEETIIMLPEGCQYVFLSATIPNAQQFADWVEHVHPRMRCHVVHTSYRPVPLQHFLYPMGADGIYLAIDDKGQFREDSFMNAMKAVGGAAAGADGKKGEDAAAGGGDKGARKGGRRAQEEQMKGSIQSIVRLVMEKQMYPVIVFGFAKAECERNAISLAKLSFNNDEEDALVCEVYNNAIEQLSSDDRGLPAVEHLLPLLRRGVGIHHSGLLPILKEVVEVLFQAGLVKCLFSTETFSMGLNMPARTVVFTAVKKWDGEDTRYLTGGEYIQMSGRAGRRGLDKFGVVIAMVDQQVEAQKLKELMGGGSDTLNSSFHLTYNMVLNLLRVEDVDPQFMMMRSFLQFQREHRRPQLEAQIAKLEAERDALPVSEEQAEIFDEYIAIQDQLEVMRRSQRDLCNQPRFVKGFLAHGRAVRVIRRSDHVDFGWGIIIGAPRASLPTASEEDPAQWLVDVAVIVGKAQLSSGAGTATPVAINDFASDTAELMPLPFTFADIATISSMKINLPQRLDDALKLQVVRALALKLAASDGALKAMTPQELGVTEEQCAPYAQVAQRVATLERQLARNEVAAAQAAAETAASKELLAAFEHFRARQEKDREISAMRNDLRAMQRTILTEDLKKMMRVMRRMDYIDGNNVLMRKGRVACEITTSDENEILLTELLFRGTLKDMETEMIVALLSCLVNVHRTPDNFALPEEFRGPLQDLKDIVKRIATVSIESGLTGIVLEDESATAPGAAGASGATGAAAGGKSGGRKKTSYVDEKVLPSLMEATYRWAKGAKFVDVMGSTDAYEGDVVRMMRRLEELLRQMAGAARSPAVGSTELHDRFMAGIQMIKRDIIFASSLYL